jgi:hypothetical protein
LSHGVGGASHALFGRVAKDHRRRAGLAIGYGYNLVNGQTLAIENDCFQNNLLCMGWLAVNDKKSSTLRKGELYVWRELRFNQVNFW